MNKLKFIAIGLLLVCSFGCFTSRTLNYAGNPRLHNELKFKESYIDQNDNLVVNFEAKIETNKHPKKYYIILNLDSVYDNAHFDDSTGTYILDSTICQKLKIKNAFYHLNGSVAIWHIDLQKEIMQKGSYKPTSIKTTLTKNRFDDLKQQNVSFVYNSQFEFDKRNFKHCEISFSIEDTWRESPWRYCLTPLGIVADIVTAPIQMIAIILYLINF